MKLRNSGSASIFDSTFMGNTATNYGGAIENSNSLSLINVTLSGNSAGDMGSGGIENSGSVSVLFSTLISNTSTSEAYGGNIDNSNVFEIKASIVAFGGWRNCEGGITSLGYNIENNNYCNFNGQGDLPNTNPLLGALADNGGPTLTHSPLTNSPVLDRVPVGDCVLTDQRGINRPQNTQCDVGAVEVAAGEVVVQGQAVADAYIIDKILDFNGGGLSNLAVGYVSCNNELPTCLGKALVRFDLPALPPDAQIVEAIAVFYAEPGYSNGLPVGVHTMTSPWDEQTVTWNTQPSISSGNWGIPPIYSGGWYGSDITTLVADWYVGAPNYGVELIYLNSDQFDGAVYFSSREAASNHPYLRITYRLVTPTITPTPTDTPSPTPTPETPTITPTPTTLPNNPWRDVGAIRVWANNFVQNANGRTTATGNIIVGSAALADVGKYFTVGNSITWSDSGDLALSGVLAFVQGNQALGQGTFAVNRNTGAVTWDLGTQVLVTKLGTSQVSITPTLVVNLLQLEVQATGAVNLMLPENGIISTNISFVLGQNFTITGSATAHLAFALAGGTLTTDVRASTGGLVSASASYAIPSVGTVTLQDLVIDGKGDAKLHFGAGLDFVIPNLNLGQDKLLLTQLKGQIQMVSTGGQVTSYSIALSGKLVVLNLPELEYAETTIQELKLANGTLTGRFGDIKLKVAGRDLTMKGPTIRLALMTSRTRITGPAAPDFSYTLFATESDWSLPAAWTPPGTEAKVLLQKVTLSTSAPYIQIGSVGGKFTTTQPIYLGGDQNAANKVRFDQMQGEIRYQPATGKFNVLITARVSMTLGQDFSSMVGVQFTVSDGHVNATIPNAQLAVAGLALSAASLAYQDDAFTAATVTLKLPAKWGTGSLTATGLRITRDSFTLGGTGGTFLIPDQSLGILKLTSLSATVSLELPDVWTLVINGVATITNNSISKASCSMTAAGMMPAANTIPAADVAFTSSPDDSILVSIQITIRCGQVTGTVNAFGFEVAGLQFCVEHPSFLNDRIMAQSVTAGLPQKLGGFGFKLYGLEIGGPKGISLQGGGFRLPDFNLAQKVSVRNAMAEFVRLPDGTYTIKGSADLGFNQFTVGGSFWLVYDPPNSLGLREVRISWQGSIANNTAIPVANTGFYFTGISGIFDLNSGTLKIDLAVDGSYAYEVAGVGLFNGHWLTTITFAPWEIRFEGTGRFLIIPVSHEIIRINDNSFTMDAETEHQLWRGIFSLAFGKDIAGQLTVYGKARLEAGIKQGSLLHACLPIVGCADVPPGDYTIAQQTYDAGRFAQSNGSTAWGARTTVDIFGMKAYVFLRWAPTASVDVGRNLNAYTPVLPQTVLAAASGRTTYVVTVGAPTTRLTVAEIITPTNRTNPQTLQVTLSTGVSVTPTMAYESADRDLRTYAIDLANPNDAEGTWTLSTQDGNILKVWGADLPAQVNSFTVTTFAGITLADASAANGQHETLKPDQSLHLTWNVTNDEPGLALEVFAESEDGTRYPVAIQRTDEDETLSGQITWTPVVPSGMYTFTLLVDDFRNVATVAAKQVVQIVDTAAPAAPSDLTAQPRGDGSVLLSWNAATVEPDVQGYLIYVDDVLVRTDFERINQYELFVLSPDTTRRIGVAAFDLSNNIGPISTVQAAAPSLGLVANYPRRDEKALNVREVWGSFNRQVTISAFTLLDEHNQPVPGATTPIRAEIGISETVTLGVRLVPTSVPLPTGVYTAQLTARDEDTGEMVTITWPFEAIAAPINIYLPVVMK